MPEFELHFGFVLGSEMQPRQQLQEESVNPTREEVLEVIGQEEWDMLVHSLR